MNKTCKSDFFDPSLNRLTSKCGFVEQSTKICEIADGHGQQLLDEERRLGFFQTFVMFVMFVIFGKKKTKESSQSS